MLHLLASVTLHSLQQEDVKSQQGATGQPSTGPLQTS